MFCTEIYSCNAIWCIKHTKLHRNTCSVVGLTGYLTLNDQIVWLPNQQWYCALGTAILGAASMSSVYIIISMTFDRFYSIIRPHKSASFNTVKRAKISIVCIVLIAVLYNIPHLFITDFSNNTCITYSKGMKYLAGKVFYYGNQVINFGLPFTVLLFMNSVIIHTLRKRSKSKVFKLESTPQGEKESQSLKLKNSEIQIIIMLLLVTFGYLILIPVCALGIYSSFVKYQHSSQLYAGLLLIYAVGRNAFYTNFGINFYLYVLSGQKFRTDLVKLYLVIFPCLAKKLKHRKHNLSMSGLYTSNSAVTSATESRCN